MNWQIGTGSDEGTSAEIHVHLRQSAGRAQPEGVPADLVNPWRLKFEQTLEQDAPARAG